MLNAIFAAGAAMYLGFGYVADHTSHGVRMLAEMSGGCAIGAVAGAVVGLAPAIASGYAMVAAPTIISHSASTGCMAGAAVAGVGSGIRAMWRRNP